MSNSTVVQDSSLERRVFTTHDGRILGNEVRIDQHYRPFSGTSELTPVEQIVATAGPFYDMAEAGRWVDELRCAQDVARAQAFRAKHGGSLVII